MALFTILRRFFPVSRFGIEYPRVGCARGRNRPNKINNLLSIVRALYVAACCRLFAFVSGHFRAFLKFHGNSMRHGCDMKRVGRRDPQIRCSTPPHSNRAHGRRCFARGGLGWAVARNKNLGEQSSGYSGPRRRPNVAFSTEYGYKQ